MKVIVFGATGMVGQGVIRECLMDAAVESILAIVRSPIQQQNEKLQEIVHADFLNFKSIEAELTGYDACFFCLGISSAGMTEQAYERITYDITISVAQTLVRLNPQMNFIFVSGAGTDSTERGARMWARIKGKAENALLRLQFRAVYVFRPAFIQPLHGIVSKTKIYRVLYAIMTPFYPIVRRIFPKYVTTTEQIGRAMIFVVKHGAPKQILENDDINKVGERN